MPGAPFLAIDHVQLVIPPGSEDTARGFYRDLLGMSEIPKPPALVAQGGAWFSSGSVNIHLGVELDFRPAAKAHPALLCADYDQLVETLRTAGVALKVDERIPGVRRCHIFDPFGNRIELVAC